MQLNAARCSSMQLDAARCSSMQLDAAPRRLHDAAPCSSMQLNAARCSSMQLDATPSTDGGGPRSLQFDLGRELLRGSVWWRVPPPVLTPPEVEGCDPPRTPPCPRLSGNPSNSSLKPSSSSSTYSPHKHPPPPAPPCAPFHRRSIPVIFEVVRSQLRYFRAPNSV